MYYEFYIFTALIICSLFSLIASSAVHSVFNKYSKRFCASKLTGSETAKKLLASGKAYDISVQPTKGTLTDYYDPKNGTVNLSQSTFNQSSVASVAVAAHEIGHVMQKQQGYVPYVIRTALVPIVNIASRLSLPLVVIGLVLDILSNISDVGFYVAIVGIIFYSGSFIFALATLPVEINASRRASSMLLQEGILTENEISGARKVLFAAAMTYLASLLTSLVYFLRFLFRVLMLFGRRNDRR